MRSRAHFNGHPLHPILVAFPIAFICGGFLADVVGRLADWPAAWTVGAFLSGAAILTGLAAGVPGFVDYRHAVPPNSSAKRRALQHMLVNVSALAAFAVGWAFRDLDSLKPGDATLLLEGAGVGLVMWGGWLGGTLVYRNQIGVDHRYAEAGKWKEQTVTGRPGEAVVVAAADELKVDQMKLIRYGERRLVLARTEQGYVVFDDHCTHRGGSLADGVMTCATVSCPWHGSQFDVRTGAVKAGPADRPIGTHQVEQSDGQVRLTLPG
jgi:nitrite reductase/ring-hydroxylating ferredoxin subunit/uncharacterized membrane protein